LLSHPSLHPLANRRRQAGQIGRDLSAWAKSATDRHFD